MSRAAPSLLLANEQQDLTLVIKLVEATRERKLAALRISELASQAVDTLLYAANTVACPQKE